MQKVLAFYPNPTIPNGDGATGTLFFPSESREKDEDATIKIDHLLKHRELVPRLRETGCLFVTSAVETVDLQQSTWGRLLGFGNVRVTGRGESSLVFVRVADPVAVKRAIETAYAANIEHTAATR